MSGANRRTPAGLGEGGWRVAPRQRGAARRRASDRYVPNVASQIRTALSRMTGENPLQIARRRADQAQHLRGRGLLLQGLVQFLPIALKPLLQAGSGRVLRLIARQSWVWRRHGACGRPPSGAANPLPCHQPCRAASSDPPRLEPAPIIRNGASRRHVDTDAAASILWRFIAGFAAFAVTAVTTAGGDGARQASFGKSETGCRRQPICAIMPFRLPAMRKAIKAVRAPRAHERQAQGGVLWSP